MRLVRSDRTSPLCQEEFKLFQSDLIPGSGLSARLDNTCSEARRLVSNCPEPPTLDSWISDVSDFLEDISDDLDSSSKAAQELRNTSWSEWQDRAFQKGSRIMHRYTRLRSTWQPTVVQTTSGHSAEPSEVLRETFEKHETLWNASQTPPRAWIPNRDCFPRASPDELRAVSRKFPEHTGSSLDGFYPRSLSFLCDSALDTLSALYECIERLGLFPAKVFWTLMPLLEKPQGGLRAILLVAGIVRMWQRLRKPFAQPFLDLTSRSYWACGAGRSAEATV